MYYHRSYTYKESGSVLNIFNVGAQCINEKFFICLMPVYRFEGFASGGVGGGGEYVFKD